MIPNQDNTLPPVIIELKGIVPGKKNNKLPGKNGRVLIKREYKKRLNQLTDDLELKLLLACQTASGATLTGSLLRSWIVSSLPGDDCWTVVPEILIKGELCEPGSEGVTIRIQKLT